MLHLDVNDMYLDPDWVGGDRSQEWEDLRKDIEIAVERNPRYGPIDVKVIDTEWMGEAEAK